MGVADRDWMREPRKGESRKGTAPSLPSPPPGYWRQSVSFLQGLVYIVAGVIVGLAFLIATGQV